MGKPHNQVQQEGLKKSVQNLLDFLRELTRSKSIPVRSIEECESYRWIEDLPFEVRETLDRSAGPGNELFSIKRVVDSPPPQPPARLDGLVQGIGDSSGSPSLVNLGDFTKSTKAEFQEIFDTWMPTWHSWAKADRLIRPLVEIYAEFSGISRNLSSLEDEFELVLGTGFFTLTSPEGDYSHPIYVTRLATRIDPATEIITVSIPEGTSSRFADRALFKDLEIFRASETQELRDRVRVEQPGPLSEEMIEIFSDWLHRAFPTSSEFDPKWRADSTVGPAPSLCWAPVLMFRKRDSSALEEYYDAIIDQLAFGHEEVPLGLAQLLEPLGPAERLAWLENEGALDATDLGEDPLFPLPANVEQRAIMERLKTDTGVVIQGPPGTGKTHSIANIITALLARGQRVLVTSQKAQALREIRDKLPFEVQQLCISMTDLARGGSSELDLSVTTLSDRYSSHSPETSRQLISEQEEVRTRCRITVERIKDEILSLRESEIAIHPEISNGYSGTLATISKAVSRSAQKFDWFPVPLEPEAPNLCPLNNDELGDLLELLRTETPERIERSQQAFPPADTLPDEKSVLEAIAAESQIRSIIEDQSDDLANTIGSLGSQALADLHAIVDFHPDVLGGVKRSATWPTWMEQSLIDNLASRNTFVWDTLRDSSEAAFEAAELLKAIGTERVILPRIDPDGPNSSAALITRCQALADSLAKGNTIRRFPRPAVQRAAQYVLDGSTVGGLPIQSSASLDLAMKALHVEKIIHDLASVWSGVGIEVSVEGSSAARVDQLLNLANDLKLLDRIVHVGALANRYFADHRVDFAISESSSLQKFLMSLERASSRVALANARAVLNAAVSDLENMVIAGSNPPEVDRLRVAIVGREVEQVEQVMDDLWHFSELAQSHLRCNELLGRLKASNRALASSMAETRHDNCWDDRLEVFEQAWVWAFAYTYLDGELQRGKERELAEALNDAESRLASATAKLAALQAWDECLSRMTPSQERSLRSYQENIGKLGKGTGRYAARHRAGAQQAMVGARGAVPAWIMPIAQVVETIPPTRNSFDVVIIDEASQASIESAFLLWLAPRVIVVGDEKQCAPSQIAHGELQPIFDRLDDALPNVPMHLRNAFTPKSNLFTLLQSRFGAVIRLREHFRCMPEIITWSSQQFYRDKPLIPLRQFGADRLAPLKVVRVTGGFTEGSGQRIVNKVEAEALMAKLKECHEDPAYDGKTFGVIALQGRGQIDWIESELWDMLSTGDIDARRLVVGGPADFQGAERDVMFLSMVAANEPRALTGLEAQRRFNVAASRARDQMWLFSSNAIGELSTKDLRRSLLQYMMSPPSPMVTTKFDHLTWDSERVDPFDSKFEQRVFIALRDRNYAVTPQYKVNERSIDMVVTGAKGRLAVECDGDFWHSKYEDRVADIEREQQLRRAGWEFWRIRESEFYTDPERSLEPLWLELERRGIHPGDLGGLDQDQADSIEVWEPMTLDEVEVVGEFEDDAPASRPQPTDAGSSSRRLF